MKITKILRVNEETYQKLKQIKDRTGVSMTKQIELAMSEFDVITTIGGKQ